MTEIEVLRSDIDRLRETVEGIFNHMSYVYDDNEQVDAVSTCGIVQSLLNSVKDKSETKYDIDHSSGELATPTNPNLSKQVLYMRRDIGCLQDAVYHILVEAFHDYDDGYFNSNYNWMYFAQDVTDRLLDPEQSNEKDGATEPEEIARMKNDIDRLQTTVYQVLGVVYEEHESDAIYGHFNWMKFGKVYTKDWLNDAGEPHSESDNDMGACSDDADEEDCEYTHYFEYKYLMEHILNATCTNV
jgi:hypothetical protein